MREEKEGTFQKGLKETKGEPVGGMWGIRMRNGSSKTGTSHRVQSETNNQSEVPVKGVTKVTNVLS